MNEARREHEKKIKKETFWGLLDIHLITLKHFLFFMVSMR